mgnify:CR=1 FL=1
MGLKIAVLMGGASFERDFSLASGKRVCEALAAAGHKVVPLDTTGQLVPTLRSERPDAVYSALHGKHGEDGTIQSLLELLGIPYVGSSASVARSARNKSTLARRLASYREASGEATAAVVPEGICISRDAFKDMGAATALDLVACRAGGSFPLAVKPARGGSAMGVHRVDSADGLGVAVLDALTFDNEVLIERWVEGVEVAVSVVGTGESVRALPPVEICAREGLYDTQARLDADAVDYFAPPRSSSLGATEEEAACARAAIEQAALEVYRAYGVGDLGRVDMIWDGTAAHVLEVNVSPGMTELSLFPMACEAEGSSLSEMLDGLVRACVARGK